MSKAIAILTDSAPAGGRRRPADPHLYRLRYCPRLQEVRGARRRFDERVLLRSTRSITRTALPYAALWKASICRIQLVSGFHLGKMWATKIVPE